VYSAETALYAALPEQLRQSSLAMLGNLHQRVGDDTGRGAQADERQSWGRLIRVDRTINQAGALGATSDGYQTGLQIGTDLWANRQWHTGLYLGQLQGNMKVSGFVLGIPGTAAGANDLRSQYLGAYATYHGDSGFYADTVLQAGRHRYTANPTLDVSSSGKGSSVLASVEVGQSFALGGSWSLEPQAQLVWQRLSLDDTSTLNALVHQDPSSSWMARIGLRIKGEFAAGTGTVQPYARLNVYHTGSGSDVASFVGPATLTTVASRTGGTSTELAAGATWRLTPAVSVYGEVGTLQASGGDTRTKGSFNGSVGVKVHW
jgi:outer membrane autotransporter protein